jgi:hypothetical protein
VWKGGRRYNLEEIRAQAIEVALPLSLASYLKTCMFGAHM